MNLHIVLLRPEKKIGVHILPFSNFEPLPLYNHMHVPGPFCPYANFTTARERDNQAGPCWWTCFIVPHGMYCVIFWHSTTEHVG